MAFKALVFDFDGLIMDTEWPEYVAWVEVFDQHQAELPVEVYAQCLGASYQAFNPATYLIEQVDKPLDIEEIIRWHHARADELMQTLPVLPGVEDYLHEARRQGLKLAVASSSHYDWVAGKLDENGLLSMFEILCTLEDVEHVKPDPALYTLSVQRLGVEPDEAIAFEDSPNGIIAAKSAGLRCVAVPGGVSRHLSISHADLVIDSFAAVPLSELLVRLNGHGG